jgi:hypothetical protein
VNTIYTYFESKHSNLGNTLYIHDELEILKRPNPTKNEFSIPLLP